MTPAEQQQLNEIIGALETVQSQAPVKTTYARGRADHSMSHQLLDIIRKLKAFADDAASEPITNTIDSREAAAIALNAARKAGK